MANPDFIPAIKAAIKQNEIGGASPYGLEFARLGTSGASFGIFQGDTNVNDRARATLQAVLQGAGLAAGAVTALMGQLCRPLPNGNPLSPEDTATVNAALSSTQGRAKVDAMDEQLLQVVLGYLDSSTAAAAARACTIAGVAQLYISLWVNMTGAPNTLNRWLGGTTEMGVSPAAGPEVGQPDIEAYLKATSYFQQHPRNFTHMQQSVQAGAALLPMAMV